MEIDAVLVERLVSDQFPALADRTIRRVRSTGTVNAIYRLGDDLAVRLPRMAQWAADLDREWEWLPRLAPQLSVPIPEPVFRGRATDAYPFGWAIYRWIEGEPYADALVEDEGEAAETLARLVTDLRRVEPAADAPRGGRRPLRELDADHSRGDHRRRSRHRRRRRHRRVGARARALPNGTGAASGSTPTSCARTSSSATAGSAR